jgi:hypothetical protein
VNESVTFDLLGHTAWATGKPDGLYAFSLRQCDTVALPDKSMLVTAQIQWGGGDPADAKTSPVSLVVFRAVPPFTHWMLHGVVANASQYPTGFHGYGEGANENTITLLPDMKTLQVVFRDDDQLGRFDTDACNYTAVRSSDFGRSWHGATVLPAGTVCPVLLPIGSDGVYLLSGGRENAAPGRTMAAPGCREDWGPATASNQGCQNFDVVLWAASTQALVCGNNCSGGWSKYSISNVHNALVSAGQPHFTAEINNTRFQSSSCACDMLISLLCSCVPSC